MNNRTKTIYNTSIYSSEWAEIDDYSRTMPMEEAIGRYMERHPSKDRK